MKDGDSTANGAPGLPGMVEFGPFCLHAAPLRLCRGGAEIRLGGRALDLLAALLARPGEVLSRQELEAQVWPCSVVEDSSLRVHIAALRRALDDGAGGRYIRNVPGRGYGFIGAVSRPVPASAPPPGAATAPGNLPLSLSRLIGRDAAAAMLRRELALRRLVSIVGHGGVGKTALALAVAAQLGSEYAGGAWFADLASLTSPDQLCGSIALALGAPLSGASGAGELACWLGARRTLLVLDNCEHLLDAVALLAERLLRRAPGLVILATSREPLAAEGEWVLRLPPLAAPPGDPALGSAAALRYPAVELLAERAAASLGGFMLDAGNVHLAASLCRRLDGLPLAIEFAASRIGLLGLQEVCAQLDDQLRLCCSGRRTALPRHRTLRASLDWSFRLLSPLQQEVLRRCSVFKTALTLDAVREVIADEALPFDAVRDGLLELVAKSLVQVDLAQSPLTYSLLETTRAYAIAQLADAPCRSELLRRHAAFTLAVVRHGTGGQSAKRAASPMTALG